MIISDNEQLDDLQINGLKIIQKKDGFKFGTDAVLLSDFARDIHSDCTLDLCSGSGIIPLLLSAKTSAKVIYGVEIQSEIAKTAKRSVELNNLSDRIFIHCGDLKDAVSHYGKRRFDLITCNPPYMKAGAALLNENNSKIISRHEVLCTLEDIVKVSSKLISLTGHLVMVHRPSRLCDLIYLMRKYDIEPKRLRFIHKNQTQAPMLFLIDGLYKGKSDINILPPLYLYDKNGEETAELKHIYQRSEN